MLLDKNLLFELLNFLDSYPVRAYVKAEQVKSSMSEKLFYVIFETVDKIDGKKLEFCWPDYFRFEQWHSVRSYISEVTGVNCFDTAIWGEKVPNNVILFQRRKELDAI